jgi:hypothetical protein
MLHGFAAALANVVSAIDFSYGKTSTAKPFHQSAQNFELLIMSAKSPQVFHKWL